MASLGLTDRPVGSLNEEALGVKDYVDALSQFIESCETPMTIAIQADWGAGKTSMMNLAKEKLSNSTSKIDTMWFNTWQFSQFDMGDDLPISLLSQFVKRLGGEDSGEVIKKLASWTKKAGKAVLSTAAGNLISGADKIVSAAFEDQLDTSEQIVKLKEELESIVQKKIAKEGHDRIVIFIDDLDRLVPEKAVELLEIMKLFLDIPRCVFVLAVDYNVVIKGLEKKFGTSVDDLKGKSFFDKIIQLPFNLPVAQYDVNKYFKELLNGKFEYEDDDIETFVSLANNSVGFNPRSMKRLFNSLQLLNMVAASKNILGTDSVATAQEKQRILFAILCLQTAYEPMYRFMLKHKSKLDMEFFDTFSELASLKESEYYDEVRKELRLQEDDEEALVRFIDFLNTFYDAIQLKSDESENADEELSDKEIENLMRFLSFSSITTSNSSGIDATSGIFQFKSLVKPFFENQLLPKYEPLMKAINSKLDIWSDNKSGSIYFKYSLAALEFNFVVWRNSSQITVGLDHLNGDKNTVKQWFQTNMKDRFPLFEYNGKKKWGFLTLQRHKFSDVEIQESEEYRNDIYQNIAIEAMNKLQPLQDYHASAMSAATGVKQFLKKIEQKLHESFNAADGWTVALNDVYDLKQYQAISIRNKAWGNGTYSMYLSSMDSYFSKPYIGVSLHPDFKNAHETSKQGLFSRLEKDFDSVDNTSQSFFRSILNVKSPISGSMYDTRQLGSYDYSEADEQEVITQIIDALKKLATYRKSFSALADDN